MSYVHVSLSSSELPTSIFTIICLFHDWMNVLSLSQYRIVNIYVYVYMCVRIPTCASFQAYISTYSSKAVLEILFAGIIRRYYWIICTLAYKYSLLKKGIFSRSKTRCWESEKVKVIATRCEMVVTINA